MGRDRSSDSSSDDYRSSRKHRDDGRRKRDYKDSDRDRKRRSYSRSRSPSRRDTYRRRGSSRDRDRSRGHSSYKSSVPDLRPFLTTHFSAPAGDQQEFDGWVQILTQCDQNTDLSFVRQKYNEFLERYPYCYGFWIKFAEYEKKFGTFESMKEIWERGIITIPLSIELWRGYIAEMKLCKEFTYDKIRELYDRALELAGLEWNSDRLWLDAVEFEKMCFEHDLCSGNADANCRKIGKLFDRLLSTPTLHAQSHLERYVCYMNSVEPNLLVSSDEYQDLLQIALSDTGKEQSNIITPTPVVFHCKVIPFNNTILSIPQPEEDSFDVTVTINKHDPEVGQIIKEEILRYRQKIFDRNMKEVELRSVFENNIKRPYFHVKPLDNPQLFNWLQYLDFEIKEGDNERIQLLFERCMIACALYEEFWIKFTRWTWKTRKTKSQTREIFKRAKIHIPCSLNLTMSQAALEESLDNFDEAIKILDKFRHEQPGYVILELRFIGVLRRKAEKEVDVNYESVLNKFEALIRSSEKSPNLHSFYSMKLARFHQKIRSDPKTAHKVLKKAIVVDPLNLQLYTQFVDIAYSTVPMKEVEILQAFDLAFNSKLRLEDKIRFSQRKLDFLEELGSDVVVIEDHRDYHYQLLSELPDNTTIRTRFVNDPSRIALAPQIAPSMQGQPQWAPTVQQPVQPMMNMIPMVNMPQIQQSYMQQMPIQMPIQPNVQLSIIEPVKASDISSI